MKTINLLPKTKQQELRWEGVLHSLTVVIWISVASFAVVMLVQYATKLFLDYQTKSVQNQIAQLNQQVSKQDNATLKLKIKNINNVISDYLSLAAAAPKWSQVLKAFAKLPPQGIYINSFAVSVPTKAVLISGFAPTREKVIELYNNILQDSQDFYNIDYPLENVAQPTNITFHFTFYVRDNLLQ